MTHSAHVDSLQREARLWLATHAGAVLRWHNPGIDAGDLGDETAHARLADSPDALALLDALQKMHRGRVSIWQVALALHAAGILERPPSAW